MARINIEVSEKFRKETKQNALNNDMTLKEYLTSALKVKNETMDLITDLEVLETMYQENFTDEMHEEIGNIVNKIKILGGK